MLLIQAPPEALPNLEILLKKLKNASAHNLDGHNVGRYPSFAYFLFLYVTSQKKKNRSTLIFHAYMTYNKLQHHTLSR